MQQRLWLPQQGLSEDSVCEQLNSLLPDLHCNQLRHQLQCCHQLRCMRHQLQCCHQCLPTG